jgi:signal transduction histidine kinase
MTAAPDDSRPPSRWLPSAWRSSFRAKLALTVNIILVVLIVGFTIVFEQRQRSAIIQEVEKRATVMAEILASSITNYLLTYNYVAIEQTVRQFGKKPDLVYILVTDKEGTVAAQFMMDYPLTRLLKQQTPGQAAQPFLQQLMLPGIEGDTVYDVAYPIRVEGSSEVWGVVRLGVSLRTMQDEISRTRWQVIGFGILALFLMSVGATLMARRITQPIQALTEGVAAVGNGDFSRRIPVTSQDELGQLSSAFNAMSAQLANVRYLEERLQRANRLAALGSLAAGIAHDIRNPLTSIQIFSQLVASRPDDPSVREKFNRVVPRELQRVQSVIEDMMELARPAPLQLEPLDLHSVLQELFELHEEQLKTQRIAVTADFAPGLPRIPADAKRMHRCLGNFLINAIQAMPQGGELKVQTSQVLESFLPEPSRPPAGPVPAVQLRICDTGVGIPAERLSKIFDPFFTTKEKGLGLGMAIAHRIIEDHRGSVDVESAEGVGTVFTLCFPVNPRPNSAASATSPAHAAGNSPVP